MSDATERKLNAFIAQMSEIIESKMPANPPPKRPDWQIWIALSGLIFYGGANWMQIRSSNAAIEKIMIEHKADMASAMENISSVEDGLIAHIQDENNRALLRAEKAQQILEERLSGQQ